MKYYEDKKKLNPFFKDEVFFSQREYQAYQGHHLTSKLLITMLLKCPYFFEFT